MDLTSAQIKKRVWWQGKKVADRQQREIVYVEDEKGKEERYPLRSHPMPISKHQASKRGYKHKQNPAAHNTRKAIATQHERVRFFREKLGRIDTLLREAQHAR